MGEGKREKGKLLGPKRKRESSLGPPRPTKEKPHDQKGKGKNPARTTSDPIPVGNQTHERNEMISRLSTPQPPIKMTLGFETFHDMFRRYPN